MKIFIAFEGSCEPFDMSRDQTVGTLKLMIKDYFHVQLSDVNLARCFLELIYAGATLEDDWNLTDVGITPGSTIRCLLKAENKPILCVFCPVTKETLCLMGNFLLLRSSVSKLKSLVSLKSGLPVSVFRLTTQNGMELYNCNQLDDYDVEVGATLRLDIWDGWMEFIRGCFLGHKGTVQRYLSEEEPVLRFQQRVALYVAAVFGHLDLASWLLRRGVRAEEAVGVHPYREWCWETDHPEIAKCPIHAAVEAGQLFILKFFVNSSVLSLDCPDPSGRSPLQIAIKHQHLECVHYLIYKMWSVTGFPGLALPNRIYVQINRWTQKAQSKVSTQNQNLRAPFKTKVGDTVLVDGFNAPVMTSKPRNKVIRAEAVDSTLDGSTPGQEPDYFSCLPAGPLSQRAPVRLPQLHPAAAKEDRRKKLGRWKELGKRREIYLGENGNQNRNMWMSKVPLPPIPQEFHTRPRFTYNSSYSPLMRGSSLEPFVQHSGHTTRANAIYCLSLASAFTEKTWLQQLGMARALVRRSVQKTM